MQVTLHCASVLLCCAGVQLHCAGDIAFRFVDFVRNSTSGGDGVSDCHATVCDINQAMLDVGRRRAERRAHRGQLLLTVSASLSLSAH